MVRPTGRTVPLSSLQKHLSLDNFRTREWYAALDAAGIERRGPYHLRHTFATEALAAGISIFELARIMGASSRRLTAPTGTWPATRATRFAHVYTREPHNLASTWRQPEPANEPETQKPPG